MLYKSFLGKNGILKHRIKKHLERIQLSYPYDEMLHDLESSAYISQPTLMEKDLQ